MHAFVSGGQILALVLVSSGQHIRPQFVRGEQLAQPEQSLGHNYQINLTSYI